MSDFRLKMDDESRESSELLADPARWESALSEIADWCIDELERADMTKDDARRLGCRVALRLCREVGGSRYYWPRGASLDRAARDLNIWAEHDGTVDGPQGIRELARRYGVTDVHIWRILARQLKLHRRRVQIEIDLDASTNRLAR